MCLLFQIKHAHICLHKVSSQPLYKNGEDIFDWNCENCRSIACPVDHCSILFNTVQIIEMYMLQPLFISNF